MFDGICYDATARVENSVDFIAFVIRFTQFELPIEAKLVY